jgi:hypothetical protein
MKGRSAFGAELKTVSEKARQRTLIGRLVFRVDPMNTSFVPGRDDHHRVTGPFQAGRLGFRRQFVGRLGPAGATTRTRPRIRKVDGRRSEGVGDARKVIGRCLPPASRHREFRAPGDKRLKPTSEGVPKAVGRWAAGTEGGAKAPACDGKANFIEGVMA